MQLETILNELADALCEHVRPISKKHMAPIIQSILDGTLKKEEGDFYINGEKVDSFLAMRLHLLHKASVEDPHLFQAIKNPETAARVVDHKGFEEIGENGVFSYFQSYGICAPSYRNGIDLLNIEEPRILVLGVQSPYSLRQIVSFTQIYNPKLILADKFEGIVDLCRADNPNVESVICDFTSKEETEQLPEYDIAIGDFIFTCMLYEDGGFSVGRVLKNLHQKWSKQGGFILVESNENGQSPLYNISKDATSIDTEVIERGPALVWFEPRSLKELLEENYDEYSPDYTRTFAVLSNV